MKALVACAECGGPLDGESRFWCREHTVHLGTLRVTVTPELLEKIQNPRRDVFQQATRDAIGERLS